MAEFEWVGIHQNRRKSHKDLAKIPKVQAALSAARDGLYVRAQAARERHFFPGDDHAAYITRWDGAVDKHVVLHDPHHAVAVARAVRFPLYSDFFRDRWHQKQREEAAKAGKTYRRRNNWSKIRSRWIKTGTRWNG